MGGPTGSGGGGVVVVPVCSCCCCCCCFAVVVEEMLVSVVTNSFPPSVMCRGSSPGKDLMREAHGVTRTQSYVRVIRWNSRNSSNRIAGHPPCIAGHPILQK